MQNIEFSDSDKVKKYLFIPQYKDYKCESLGLITRDEASPVFSIAGGNIVIELDSKAMQYLSEYEDHEWFVSFENTNDLERCRLIIKCLNQNAYKSFEKSMYSKMYTTEDLKYLTSIVNKNNKVSVVRILSVLRKDKNYQKSLEDYLRIPDGFLDTQELDSKYGESSNCVGTS